MKIVKVKNNFLCFAEKQQIIVLNSNTSSKDTTLWKSETVSRSYCGLDLPKLDILNLFTDKISYKIYWNQKEVKSSDMSPMVRASGKTKKMVNVNLIVTSKMFSI